MAIVGEVSSTTLKLSDIDTICGADPASLADGETLVDLHRQRERLSAAITRATAAFDASGA